MNKRTQIIVAIDDEIIQLRCRKAILERAGYQVEMALDGHEGLVLVKKLTSAGCIPDLIVTDVKMPRVDGVELAKILGMDPIMSRIPLIFVSGGLQGYSKADLEPYGGRLLIKPYEDMDLKSLVCRVLADAPLFS